MLQLNKIESGFVNESLVIKLNNYTGFTLSFSYFVLLWLFWSGLCVLNTDQGLVHSNTYSVTAAASDL